MLHYAELFMNHRLLIALLALAAFFPTFKTGFMWDDHVMIEANPHLRQWSLSEIRRDFTTDVFNGHGDPYYRPAQTLFNRIDYTLWGLRPFGYHLTNFLMHVGCAILVMQLGLLIGLSAMAAFLAGTLFAVNPIIVQELMIIAGRGEIGSLFFMLLSLWLVMSSSRRRQVAGYAAFGVALLFKESAAAAPALLAILLAWQKAPAREYRKIVPYLVLMIPFLLARHAVVGSIPIWTRLSVAFWTTAFPRVLGEYAQLLIWPWNLHSHRQIPAFTPLWGAWLAFWPALLVALWKTRQRGLFWGLSWAIVCLLPKAISMLSGGFMLEHWAYPSLISLTWGLGYVFARAWERQQEWLSRILIPVYLGLLIMWSVFAHINVELRGSDEKNYRWSERFTMSTPIQFNLGLLLLQTNRPKEALPYLENVRATYPENADNLHALAQAYFMAGHPLPADRFIKEAKQLQPSNPEIQKTYSKITSK